jgi:hypothetical protein
MKFVPTVCIVVGLFGAAASFTPSRSFVARIATTALASGADAEAKVGDKLPDVVLKELVTGTDAPVAVDLSDLLRGKRVAIFGVPGAFTPGCSKSHLPSFINAQGDLKAKGVQVTICVATNDAYTMEVSGRSFPALLCLHLSHPH